MKNEEYVRLYKLSGDKQYLDSLYYNVEKMLYKIKYDFNCELDETYVGFMKAVRDYDESRGKFITFLYNVVKNEILQERRKKKLDTTPIDTEIGDGITIGDTIESGFDLEETMQNKYMWEKCMKNLTDIEREIAYKYYKEDKTFKTIASEMGMSARQIQSRHEKMLNRLKGVFYNGK